MSEVKETCACGAEWTGHQTYSNERDRFREAHKICRETLARTSEPPGCNAIGSKHRTDYCPVHGHKDSGPRADDVGVESEAGGGQPTPDSQPEVADTAGIMSATEDTTDDNVRVGGHSGRKTDDNPDYQTDAPRTTNRTAGPTCPDEMQVGWHCANCGAIGDDSEMEHNATEYHACSPDDLEPAFIRWRGSGEVGEGEGKAASLFFALGPPADDDAAGWKRQAEYISAEYNKLADKLEMAWADIDTARDNAKRWLANEAQHEANARELWEALEACDPGTNGIGPPQALLDKLKPMYGEQSDG